MPRMDTYVTSQFVDTNVQTALIVIALTTKAKTTYGQRRKLTCPSSSMTSENRHSCCAVSSLASASCTTVDSSSSARNASLMKRYAAKSNMLLSLTVVTQASS